MQFRQFFMMTTYLRAYSKLSELHFNLLLFTNCREKVLKSRGEIGQIWDWSLEPSPCDWRTTIHWNVVLTILHKPWDMWSLWKIVRTTFQCIIMRPCLNELQKENCVKKEVIALNWKWVTLRSWCQINSNGQSSQVKQKVEGKPH